ncbi:MAG: DUF4349 domain-containing protein [Eubacterium sp.]|nr:DUF4349 domain-containing protein [Eubacterium sp.]
MKKFINAFLAASICLALTACGSSASTDSGARSSVQKAASNSAGYVDSYDYAATEAAYEDVEYETAAGDEPVYEESDESVEGDVSDKENKTNKLDTEKLIYRCNISLETLRFDDTVSEFQKIITKYNGFIESENTYINSTGYYESSGLGVYVATVRVPSDKYKDFVNETGGIGTLINRSQNVTNVSQEYSDLSVELEVLEAQKADYLEMLKEAKKLEDMDNVILISDKISSVSTQINQIKTRLNSIDNDVAYSYVDVNIKEVKEIVEHSEDSFGTRFMKEVKQGWYDFFFGLQNFIIWIVANIWGLLIFFGIIALIIFIIKKIIKKSRKKKEERMARMYPGYVPQTQTNAPAAKPQANAKPQADAKAAQPEDKKETAEENKNDKQDKKKGK